MKSTMEQIYDYVKEHPDVTVVRARDDLALHVNSASSLFSQLEVRGALRSTKKWALSQGGKQRLIKHYQVAIPDFCLLPVPIKQGKPVTVPILPATVQLQAEPSSVAVSLPSPSLLLRDATQAQLLEQLIRVQRAEVKREIELAIMERISAAFAEPGATPELEPERPAARLAPVHGLRRYLIVGLLPAQALITTAKLSAACELRYWKDESTDRLRQHARWADVVVVMTKFISHSTQAVAKVASTTLLSCNGGVSDLVAQITHDIDANSLH